MRAFTVRYRVAESEDRRDIRVFANDKREALATFASRYPQHCAVGVSEEGSIPTGVERYESETLEALKRID